MKSRRRTVALGFAAFLFALVAALTPPPAQAGFTQGKYVGQKLSDAQKAVMEAAIAKLRQLAAGENSNHNRSLMTRVANAMENALKQGRINQEGARNPTWSGVCLMDDKTSMKDDKINFEPDILTTAPPAFNLLVATMMHEGIHMLQPSYRSESQHELPAYKWTVYILGRLDHPTTTDLAFYRECVRRHDTTTTAGKKASSAATRMTSSLSGTIHYVSSITWSPSVVQLQPPWDNPIYIGDSFFDVFMDIELWEEGPMESHYLLASGTVEDTSGNIAQFFDTNGDFVYEDPPEPLIPDTEPNPLRIPRALAKDEVGNLFILDVGYTSPVIYLMRDPDLDGRFDPVAEPFFYPGVVAGESASSDVLDIAVTYPSGFSGPPAVEFSYRSSLNRIQDWYESTFIVPYDPASGMPLDSYEIHPAFALSRDIEPFFPFPPFEGDESVMAGGQLPAEIELVQLDLQSLEPIQVLGQGVIDTPGLRAQIPVTVPPASADFLTSGLLVAVVDKTNSVTGTATLVTPPYPQIDLIEPELARSGQIVAAVGSFFPTDARAVVAGIDAYTSAVGSGRVEFVMPYLPYDDFTTGFPQSVAIVSASVDEDGEEAGVLYLGEGANNPPLADAGASQTVTAGDNVTLDGTGSLDWDAESLAFAWTQLDPFTVTLADADTSAARFVAPATTETRTLSFRVEVTDRAATDTAEVNVVVVPGAPPPVDKGDINDDGVIDEQDFALLIDFILGRRTPTPDELARGDINDDGRLDMMDVVLLAALF